MSKGEDPGDESPAAVQAAAVGYKHPPAKHRFKKGVSGNPNGRPRKNAGPSLPERPSIHDIVVAEAYRPVSIKENNEIIQLPLMQALIRSMAVSAIKGSHRAQVVLANMFRAAQTKDADERRAVFEATIDYKKHWESVFAEFDRLGKPRPETVPHPDDIAVNARTGEIIINGPFDDSEKALWDKAKQDRADALDEIAELRKRMKRSKGKAADFSRLIESAEQTVEFFDSLFPDEEARRQPGFNIHRWRERQEKLQKLKRKFSR